MTSWQKRARVGVATVGLTSAVVVYLSLGERAPAPEPAPAPRLEPGVVVEGIGVQREQVGGKGEDQQPVISSARTLTYDDGSTRAIDVRIEGTNRHGRTFVVTAAEGHAGKDNLSLELEGDVVLRVSDGFELRSDRGTYDKQSQTIRADGDVTFLKGRMAGSGRGMTYEEDADVLRLEHRARIDVQAGEGAVAMHFEADAAELDRRQHVLTLERSVHAVQGMQEIDADRAVARLSDSDDEVTFVELRGHAQVAGGNASFESMRAGDIDLDYIDGGSAIERASLRGAASIVLAGTGGKAGREFGGEFLDVHLGTDGALAQATGHGGVEMRIPAEQDAPARRIEGQSFEAEGTGGALTTARFTGAVRFEEAAGTPRTRTATAAELALDLADEAIRSAVFTGDATFAGEDFRARAAGATYVPGSGGLRLRGRDHRGRPLVTDTRVAIEADEIDVGLEARRVDATRQVEVTVRGAAPRAATERAEASAPGRLPGLLKQEEQATVVSKRLTYLGPDGTATFTGDAKLWQGATEIRGDEIEIRQETGDLLVRSSAHTTMALDADSSEGEADEIRYTDRDRTILYLSIPRTGEDAPEPRARVTGVAGDLRARRIEVRLAAGESRVDRVDAQGAVTARVDGSRVTGDTLAYRAADGTYHVTAARGGIARVEEACRIAEGLALTFSRSTDTMNVDGQTVFRTRNKRRSGCEPPPSR